jgi:hypothetical protein
VHAWAKNDDPDDERMGERVYTGRLLAREETIARGSCDPHILVCRSPAV